MSEFDVITNTILDDKSKNKFWSKVAPSVREATKKAGFDPTDFLEWNGDTGNWYMKEQDLLCWFKIVYPTSIIQTEKAMLEMGVLCQYKVKIHLTPDAEIPNIFEGPVILKDDNFFFTNTNNYIATARTMAIGNALRHCGFGCQVNDEYFVVDTSTAQQPPSVNTTNSN
ncbi:MAG: hypothetical protein J1E41_08195, partial [Ruminococcus sp.]|nr:hypothetical protein [Ruminococcus sp.]